MLEAEDLEVGFGGIEGDQGETVAVVPGEVGDLSKLLRGEERVLRGARDIP